MELRTCPPLAEIVDLATLVSRFSADGVLAVPRSSERFVGRAAIARFLASPAGGELDRVALVKTRANYQPAIAVYRCDATARAYRAHGIFVLVECGKPADVVAFLDPTLFPIFELPETIE